MINDIQKHVLAPKSLNPPKRRIMKPLNLEGFSKNNVSNWDQVYEILYHFSSALQNDILSNTSPFWDRIAF